MKIEYRILWLDDKIQDFIDDELVEELEDFIKEKGFSPEIITTDKQENFLLKLDDSYDLILTDYHMGAIDGQPFDGDRIVEEVRRQAIPTEILFYTARADLKDTNKINRISFLETNSRQGIHSAVLLAEAKSLISLTIKKFEHIVAMRGMIMHETSSLDMEMLHILDSFINNPEKAGVVVTFGAEILEEAKAHFSSKLKLIEKLLKTSDLKALSKDNFVFSSAYKVKTMGKILEHLHMDDFSENYKDKIVNMRNTFAHAVLETDGETGRKYFTNGDITFDEELCKKIRKDIIKYKSDLISLAENLNE